MSGDDAEPTRSPRLWIIAGVAVVVLGVAAWLLWPRTPPDHVLIVGDSVSFMSLPDAVKAFDGTSVEGITRPGYRTTDLLPLVKMAIDDREQSGKELDQAIFLVGYNDVWRSNPRIQDLETLVDQSARYRCAIWLTLPARPGGKPPATTDFDPAGADTFNQRLAKLVCAHRLLLLVTDWAQAVDAAPADRYLIGDGIHPNQEGMKLLAQIMHYRLAEECPVGPIR